MFSHRRSRVFALAAVALVAVVPAPVAIGATSGASTGATNGAQPGDCASLADLTLPRTTVDSAVEDAGDASTPPSCRATLTVDDPGDGGKVTVWVYLPTENWNGRFQGVGGGGFLGGDKERLLEPLRAGYAAAATDAGHEGATADFALTPEGRLNWPAIKDYGHEGIHDMTVTAKAVVKAFYGTPAEYSYFNGCSTGGRQGVMEAQRHPDAYDGILAGAPVINFTEMQTGQIWGQVAMLEEDNPVAGCKFEAATAALVEACDTLGDGVADGVIGDPLACRPDLSTLVGQETPCGTITAADVDIMRSILQGPRRGDGEFLWYGLAPGASFADLNDTIVRDGELVGNPFVYDLWWIGLFLAQDREWDWTTLTYARFESYFEQAVSMYDDVLGATDPDLSPYARSGGKLLMWHGAADGGVAYQGTLDYYERVLATLGPGATHQFARLFVATGVGHCGGGAGPQLTDPLAALVKWVEHGKAPRTLDAARSTPDGSVTATRPVCVYPFVARWTGRGDADDGANYRCVPGTRHVRPA